MTEDELRALLHRLRAEPDETEWLEFKANRYEPKELGEYLSALANAAALHGKPRAYLVFGVEDGTHTICGTSFKPVAAKGPGNQSLLIWLATQLQPSVGFEVHTLIDEGRRVVIFEVNPATDQPVRFKQAAYIRVGTSKTVLANHPEKERALWARRIDWSAQICDRATLEDLDPAAVRAAREQYVVKNPRRAEEAKAWDDPTFLNKSKLTIRGAVTNAAILLVGRE